MSNIPSQIQTELDKLDESGIPYEIRDAKDRRLIFVNGLYCASMPRSTTNYKADRSMQNAVAGIRREARKIEPPSNDNDKPQEKNTMTQNPETAAINGRLGAIEQGLQALLKFVMEMTDEQKIARRLIEDCAASGELTVTSIGQLQERIRESSPQPAAPALPKGWLSNAIRELMKDGEHRHVFEIWKTIKEQYPALSESSLASACAALSDQGDLKRERQGIYFAPEIAA